MSKQNCPLETANTIYEIEDYIENTFGGAPYSDAEQRMIDALDYAIEALEIEDRLEQANVNHHFDRIAELRTSPFSKDGDYYYIEGYEDALKDIRGDTE